MLSAWPDSLERLLPADVAWTGVVRVCEPVVRAFQRYGNALEQEGFCRVEQDRIPEPGLPPKTGSGDPVYTP